MARLDDRDEALWQRFEDRCRMRGLPSPIRRQLGRVRNSFHLTAPLSVVTTKINEIAEREGVIRETSHPDFEPRRYIPAIFQRQIHRQLVGDRALVSQVRNEVDSALEDGNRDRRMLTDYPETLPDCRPPARGIWTVASDVGFGLATQFEAKPEGFAVGVAQRTWARQFGDPSASEDVGVAEDFRLAVLDWGAFGGMTTHALTATKPGFSDLRIYEHDVIGEATESPFVQPPEALDDEQLFDLIVVTVPVPGKGGSFQYRNRYKNDEQKHAIDMGTVGPARWMKGLQFLASQLPSVMAERGEIVFLLPESVRVERGYEPAPDLLEGFVAGLAAQGLVITHDLEVVESGPLAQPFVGTSRPVRRCFIARGSTSEPERGSSPS